MSDTDTSTTPRRDPVPEAPPPEKPKPQNDFGFKKGLGRGLSTGED